MTLFVYLGVRSKLTNFSHTQIAFTLPLDLLKRRRIILDLLVCKDTFLDVLVCKDTSAFLTTVYQNLPLLAYTFIGIHFVVKSGRSI